MKSTSEYFDDYLRQRKIHNEISEDLGFFIGDEALRKEIVKAIVRGNIRNLIIKYGS